MADAILTRDKAGVLKIWDMHDKPIFSIWENKRDPAFHNADERETERERFLHECLDFILESQTTSIFIIKFHDEPNKNGKITSATPVIGSLSFRLNEPNTMRNGTTAVTTTSAAGMDMMKELFESRLQMIDLKFQHELEKKQEEIDRLQLEAAAEAEPDDGYEDDDNLGMIGKIGELGERYPWMQGPINQLIAPITDLISMTTNKMRREYPASAINGLNDTVTDQPAQAPPETARTDTRRDDERVKTAQRALINYFVNYHGFPPGSTNESIQAMPEEQREVYRLQGFKKYADTMVGLASLAQNKPDTMLFALNTLEGLK